ncbi:EAL domain-containing protein [Acidisoma cellulosilytica]|uniref:EAL domain-containing protein n=1 Tax=Acidisoma cellulosilyticum TaxID=2802395 RepID=A0A963YZK7_9PROT|nr:EAL domain-containing protein [Acidisoma cellulosilyticum]MCB8879267.1 EAL domain-containing protein [Acidisoma cellulosilyticum]
MSGPGFWSGLSRASRRLLLSGAVLLLAMMAMIGLAIGSMRLSTLNLAQHSIERISFAVAEQSTRAIQGVDLILTNLRDEAERRHPTPSSLAPLLQDPASKIRSDLRDAVLPQADGFAIIDAKGDILVHTSAWPDSLDPGHDHARLNYLRINNDNHIFISLPFWNDSRQDWFVYIARRINDADGNYSGAVIGVVSLGYFHNFYRTLVDDDQFAVTLFNRQGITLASYPLALPTGQRPARLSKLWDQVVFSGQERSFEGSGLTVQGRRLIAVRPIAAYPLVVNVSIAKAAALATWQKQALLALAGAVCATLCTLLLLRAVMLQLQRLEQSEFSLAEQSARLATTLDHITDGVVMIDAEDRISVCNQRVLELLDLPAGLMSSRPTLETVLAYHRAIGEYPNEAVADHLLQQLRARTPSVVERHRPNGTILEVQTLPLPEGGLIRTYTDITERRRSEAQIRYLAHHDPLTHLANRALFRDRLEQDIARADAAGHRLALLYIDLDRFKFINDMRGHEAGDKLLVEVGRRMRAITSTSETVARMGGDEFAVILPLDRPGRTAADLANGILRTLQRPMEMVSASFHVSLSIGIAHYPDHAGSAEDLLRNADIALYQAKTDGVGLWREFDATMQARQALLFEREQDLRNALGKKQFTLAYQPILDTGTRQSVGCEALLRWTHPTHGSVPPSEFVGLMEKLGLIVPIGRWVLETACLEAVHWPADTHVAVNLSPIQMNDEGLVDEVKAILIRSGLPAHRLTLEVTETSLLEDNPIVRNTMDALRAIGIRFSLDDFGTGHSGLGYLRRFPFDGIKIDKLFIQDMVEQPDAAAIVNALLAVSAELNLDVVAEGVETEAQYEALRQRHCQYVQGHYFAKPLADTEARRFILTHRTAPIPL